MCTGGAILKMQPVHFPCWKNCQRAASGRCHVDVTLCLVSLAAYSFLTTLSPINMEPDSGVLEDHFPFEGTPCSGSMLVGGRGTFLSEDFIQVLGRFYAFDLRVELKVGLKDFGLRSGFPILARCKKLLILLEQFLQAIECSQPTHRPHNFWQPPFLANIFSQGPKRRPFISGSLRS